MVAACLDPVFDEEFHIANIDDRTSIKFTFMDKDVIGPDDYLGAVELKLNLQVRSRSRSGVLVACLQGG